MQRILVSLAALAVMIAFASDSAFAQAKKGKANCSYEGLRRRLHQERRPAALLRRLVHQADQQPESRRAVLIARRLCNRNKMAPRF